MPDIEYHRLDAKYNFPGILEHVDVCDAISNMNACEKKKFRELLVERDESGVGQLIMESIERQYAEKIEELAQQYLKDEQEAQPEDAEDAQAEHAREMRTLREGRDAA